MAQWRQYSHAVGSWELSFFAAAFGAAAAGFSAALPRATGNSGSAEVPTRKPPSEPKNPRREVRLATRRVEFSVKESSHFMRFTDSLLNVYGTTMMVGVVPTFSTERNHAPLVAS
jgi:hypothetical protein